MARAVSASQRALLNNKVGPLGETLTVYTHPDCSYSDALKDELNDQEIPFEEIDLAVHPEQWATLEGLTGGERITPVSVEGDLVTVGYNGVG